MSGTHPCSIQQIAAHINPALSHTSQKDAPETSAQAP